MQTSESINEFAAALAKAQATMAKAAKDSTNPHFKSKYADLASISDACREALTANNIAVLQGPGTTDDGAVVVATRLIHSSGQWAETSMACRPMKADAQSMGSVVTYLRRYCLAAMAGVAPDDDDGNAASAVGAPVAPQSPPQRRQPPKAPAQPSAPANGKARAGEAPSEPFNDPMPEGLGEPSVTVVGPENEQAQVKLSAALKWIRAKHADAKLDADSWWDFYYQPNIGWLEQHAPTVASELSVRKTGE